MKIENLGDCKSDEDFIKYMKDMYGIEIKSVVEFEKQLIENSVSIEPIDDIKKYLRKAFR